MILSSNLKRVLSGRELSHSQKYNEWRKFAFFMVSGLQIAKVPIYRIMREKRENVTALRNEENFSNITDL